MHERTPGIFPLRAGSWELDARTFFRSTFHADSQQKAFCVRRHAGVVVALRVAGTRRVSWRQIVAIWGMRIKLGSRSS
jgi:hypothetical protein